MGCNIAYFLFWYLVYFPKASEWKLPPPHIQKKTKKHRIIFYYTFVEENLQMNTKSTHCLKQKLDNDVLNKQLKKFNSCVAAVHDALTKHCVKCKIYLPWVDFTKIELT